MIQALIVYVLLSLGQSADVDTMEQIRARLGNPLPALNAENHEIWNAIDELKIIVGGLLECGIPERLANANAEISVVEGSVTVNYPCVGGVVVIGDVHPTTCSNGMWSDIGHYCFDGRECYVVVDGRAVYRGTQSYTECGYTCQRWDSQYPHEHGYIQQHFPPTNGYGNETIQSAANYCRDPESDGFLWCYTTSWYERWQSCDIPHC